MESDEGKKTARVASGFFIGERGSVFFYLFLLASPSDEYPPPLSMSTASGIA